MYKNVHWCAFRVTYFLSCIQSARQTTSWFRHWFICFRIYAAYVSNLH